MRDINGSLNVVMKLKSRKSRKLIGYVLKDNQGVQFTVSCQDIIKYVDRIANVGVKIVGGKVKIAGLTSDGMKVISVTSEEYNSRNFKKSDYLVRSIDKILMSWYKKGLENPIYVEGLSQVGKTCSVKRFCYTQFDNVCYLDAIVNRGICKDLYELFLSREREGKKEFTGVVKYINDNLTCFDDSKESVLIIDNAHSYPVLCDLLSKYGGNKFKIIFIGKPFPYAKKLSRKLGAGYQLKDLIILPMRSLSFLEITKRVKACSVSDLYKLYFKYGGFPQIVEKYIQSEISEYSLKQYILGICYENCPSFTRSGEIDAQSSVKKLSLLTSVAKYLLKAFEESGIVFRKSKVNASFNLDIAQGLFSREAIEYLIQILLGNQLLISCPYYTWQGRQILFWADCGIASSLLQLQFVNKGSLERYLNCNYVFLQLLQLGKVIWFGEAGIDFILYGKEKTWGIKVVEDNVLIKEIVSLNQTNFIDHGFIELWRLFDFPFNN